MIGHNGGPTMESGHVFRKAAWGRARRALLPTLPLQVIRARVRRAEALGLDYRRYASIRMATGRDIYAFLFSSNALGVLRPQDRMPPGIAARVSGLEAGLHLSQARAVTPEQFAPIRFDSNRKAPAFGSSFSQLRADMADWLAEQKLPRDAVLMIGDTAFEREQATAGRLAAFLTAYEYFGDTP